MGPGTPSRGAGRARPGASRVGTRRAAGLPITRPFSPFSPVPIPRLGPAAGRAGPAADFQAVWRGRRGRRGASSAAPGLLARPRRPRAPGGSCRAAVRRRVAGQRLWTRGSCTQPGGAGRGRHARCGRGRCSAGRASVRTKLESAKGVFWDGVGTCRRRRRRPRMPREQWGQDCDGIAPGFRRLGSWVPVVRVFPTTAMHPHPLPPCPPPPHPPLTQAS